MRLLNVAILLIVVSSFHLSAQVIEKPNTEKTLSPYFFVKSENPSTDQLPLLSTFANVDIAGVIADVKVAQIYKNQGEKPLEAVYIFPASTRAAVYNMKMVIGDRTIIAKIEEKNKAREQYEQAKIEGRSASLLEQQRPNVFQMNVANILPGDTIKVELYYTELLIPADKQYEFIYPTVVGPRYSNQMEGQVPQSELWVKNPYLHEGEEPPYQFDIKINISTGIPLQDIVCPSHKVNINYENKSLAHIDLLTQTGNGGNRDFLLKYRLAGNKIDSGLLLYEGEKENFFLLMMQPPERISINQIPQREYIFIVDVSGSMHGFPLDISKNLMRELLGDLRNKDMFNVLLFAGGSNLFAEKSVSATEENINRAIQVIDAERGGGGTELLPALRRALTLPQQEGVSRSMVIVTDGYVNVEIEAFDIIQNNLTTANLFAFGIGSSVNRYLIEGMARMGMGESFVVTNSGEAQAKANKFREYVLYPVLTQIGVEFEKFKAYDVQPQSVPDIFADRPILVFGKWEGAAKGTIHVRGYIGDKKEYHEDIDVSVSKSSKFNAALKYIWARHRLSLLSDYNHLRENHALVEEITDIGLKYNLLTAYTSFVAIDSKIRNAEGQLATIRQPLPMPQGVSEYAIGSAGGVAGLTRSAASAKSGRILTLATAEEESKSLPIKEKRVLAVDVTLGELQVDTHGYDELIKAYFSSHLSEIEKCVQSSGSIIKKSGKLIVELIIDPNGNVQKVSILSSELNNKQIEPCLIKELKSWRFTGIKNDKSFAVKSTLLFIRANKIK